MEIQTILAHEFRKNDAITIGPTSRVHNVERYVLQVLPLDLISTIRAVALKELWDQEKLHDNPASQVLVDNMPSSRRGIDRAMRRVVMRFADIRLIRQAVHEIYMLLQRITRLQSPAKNSIIARQHFHLFVGMRDYGLMPMALSKLTERIFTQDGPDTVVRVVGPLVPYGRKLFWNPVGASNKMSVRRYKSKRAVGGYRFLNPRGASMLSPQFKPYAPRTLRRKANASADPAGMLTAMMGGAVPPGRAENTGQIIKRVMKRSASLNKGLHFTDGWVEYPASASWGKAGHIRVPAYGVMMSKKGRTPGGAFL